MFFLHLIKQISNFAHLLIKIILHTYLKMKRLLPTLFLAAMMLPTFADSDVTAEKNQQNTPDGWTAVSLPNIGAITAANTFDIKNYGASTSSTDNTKAIQAALDAVPTTGGMVVIPAGDWVCGALTIKKQKTVFHLAAGAKLIQQAYGVYNGGLKTGDFPNFINVTASDVIIEGESQETSIIEGQGAAWWKAVEDKVSFKRGSAIRFTSGSRFLVRNLRTQNTPGTNITLGQSGKASHFTVHNVTISNPDSEAGAGKASHNTDGMPIWGPYVNIYDCDISTGDDNIVVDSNGHHVHAWNIKCGYGHGMSIGSYTEKVHDIIYEDITFNKTGSGFRLKTNKGRSGNDQTGTNSNGAVKNVICRNATMTGCPSPIKITSWYDEDKEKPADVATPTAITYQTPEFCNILFQNITADGVKGKTSWKHNSPIYLYGRPEMYIHDITFDNVSIESYRGMFLAYCEGITFKNGCSVVNITDGTKRISTQYKASWTGDFDGSSSEPDTGEQELLFSMVNTASSSVDVPFGTDQNLSSYATITGGSALIHNGHASKDAVMITTEGFGCANSGGSYIKITLDKALKSGDVLLTNGADGGNVTTSPSTLSEDNVSGNLYKFQSDFSGLKNVYINRGASKPVVSAIYIYRNYDPSSSIAEVSVDTPCSAYVYNLQGQRVAPDAKGLLIVNGKKIINK